MRWLEYIAEVKPAAPASARYSRNYSGTRFRFGRVTAYSEKAKRHAFRSGREINRDEVPLAYQQYVQQYFAQVRKLPASKSKAAPPSSDSKQKAAPSSTP